MWLLFKFLEEQADKRKAKKIKKRLSQTSTFETQLNGVKAKNRQEALKSLGENDDLVIDTFLIDEILGFEVFTSENKSLGVIPSNIGGELATAMEEGLEPLVTNYSVSLAEDGVYNCNVSLAFKVG